MRVGQRDIDDPNVAIYLKNLEVTCFQYCSQNFSNSLYFALKCSSASTLSDASRPLSAFESFSLTKIITEELSNLLSHHGSDQDL